MVYILTPSSYAMKPTYKMNSSGSNSDVGYAMDVSSLLNDLAPYLVIGLVSAVVSVYVLLNYVKPSENCVSFLTKKENSGSVVVDNQKVLLYSLGFGLAVALLSFALNRFMPDLLSCDSKKFQK
jgi:phosphoglycerol transferase MdoB-like AlkP superfamily enzyme